MPLQSQPKSETYRTADAFDYDLYYSKYLHSFRYTESVCQAVFLHKD